MTKPVLSLGISPCPNDTYIFEALLHDRFQKDFGVTPHIADVEELNALAAKGALDITKLSLAAVPAALDEYILINSGAALGRGCGPLVVAKPELTPEQGSSCPVAIPGVMTTANLLLSLCGLFSGPRIPMIFDQVMPSVQSGKAGLGVIIHEGRFTYAQKGLALVLDMGDWWEKHTGLPLPLGVIAVRRSLGDSMIATVQEAVRKSLEYANERPEEGRPFIRSLAQEMDTGVLASHIRTFVNTFSLQLGKEGQEAIMTLLRAAEKETGTSLPQKPVFTEA
ncbi:1,4-dihydroxy-6-naphthoate synthase [Desulfovibrio sp. OttesenSCG-928-G15]|nr:1,4-dihydroxy-6-naphthoate synthase [Desulfovibrio sp. OttesenSCG-928-G15]